jgi:hypothetical protein
MTCGPKGEELRERYRGIKIMCAVPKILRNHTHSEMSGTCSTHWDLKNDYKILVGTSTEKKPFEGGARG